MFPGSRDEKATFTSYRETDTTNMTNESDDLVLVYLLFLQLEVQGVGLTKSSRRTKNQIHKIEPQQMKKYFKVGVLLVIT